MNKEFNFYIDEHHISNDPNLMQDGLAIMKFPKYIHFKSPMLEGPFESLDDLRQNSSIFNRIAATNSKRAQQLLNPAKINEVQDLIFTELGKSHSRDFIKMMEHTWRLEVKRGEISGIHFFDYTRMNLISEIYPDKNGVWKGLFTIINENNKRIIKKSTFFPVFWNKTILFDECEFAVENMKKVENSECKYYSKTRSGVPVEIIKRNGKLVTIYPLISG